MIELCPDVQSPELSIPCPTDVPFIPSPTGLDGSGQLPYTGIETLLLVLVGVVVILFAWWLIQGMQEDDDEDM